MRSLVIAGISGIVILSLSCAPRRTADPTAGQAAVAPRMPLILDVTQGERRIRRVMGGALAIIKVDRRNGGSPDLVMGYEEIPRGQMIQAHRHPMMDEIVFIHRGTGTAELDGKVAEVAAGATIFIPKDVRVMLRNTGSEPLAIAYFFSGPGYEEYMRETSVADGEPVVPIQPEELRAIRERHKAHIVFDP